MSRRNTGKRLSTHDVLAAVKNDSESENEPELSDFELSDIENVDDELQEELEEIVAIHEHRRNGIQRGHVQNVNNENMFEWQYSEADDPYESDWLMDYNRQGLDRKGILVDTSDFEPKDYFTLFFPETVFELMSENTNLYAMNYFDTPVDDLSVHSRFHKWTDTSVEEMKKYVALQIAMGLTSKPEIEDYWGKYWLTYLPFTQVMPRNRYELLSSFLHFNNNELQIPRGKIGYDPLFKVRPLLNLVDPTYRAAYCPERELSIDESMIKFKGRIFFRQYLPAKPTRWGIKQYALCESKTGYALKFMVYTGKSTCVRDQQYSHTEQVVLDMLEGYDNKGHVVYTDNYYTSPNLCAILQEKQIGMCGTVKSNRKYMPKEFNPKVLKLSKSDDPVFMRSRDMVACAWHDTKRVHFLSTVHNNLTIDKQVRSKHGDAQDGYRMVEKPVMGEMYNKYMSGVDLLDQQLGSYSYPHKSQKWYQTIYHRMREVALVNGYILFCKCLEEKAKPVPRVFREQVIQGLLEDAGTAADENGHASRKPGRPSAQNPERLSMRHFIGTYADPKEKPDCTVCSDRKLRGWKRKQCRFYCKQCKVPLCVTPCFEIYHTIKDYRQYAAKNIHNL